jgi:hypothetical protein
MKFLTIIFTILVIAGCNFKQVVKDTGDAVEEGVGTVIDAGKKAPKEVGDASNKAEDDIRN